LQQLDTLLAQAPMLESHLGTLPSTLCHGDCHTGNLLRGSNEEWIWADWQSVRLGPGVDDLAFFWQRAFAASAVPPPYDAMMQTYAIGLSSAGAAVLSREELERNLAWSELRSWLVDWPEYLGALPAACVARVLRRIDALTDRLW
jgi:aminoglycoside phosphotransferase (APT) family kinase protein